VREFDLKEFTIGILGGMGTYATINVFHQYADLFQAQKEWDRPRVIIDNRCTMPSRVRAFLYHENEEELVDSMVGSLVGLVGMGCSHIILACNTAHIFLPHIYRLNPELENYICDAIEICVNEISKTGIKRILLLASEGTIESGIYQRKLASKGITCVVPSIEQYSNIRICIEAVKQNRFSEEIEEIFIKLFQEETNCILGCTELPILFDKYNAGLSTKNIYDPIYLALKEIKEEFK